MNSSRNVVQKRTGCLGFLHRLTQGGLDSPSSWFTAVGCCILHFICIGLNRSGGVLYKAMLVENPGTPREDISWPFTLAGVAIIYAAPITGYLSTRFHIKYTILAGILTFAAGSFPCYFYQNIVFMSVFFGLLRGTGMALATTAIPGLINNNFDRHRATAMGIAISGVSIGGFAHPLLLQKIVDTYSVNITFLFFGGISMCALIGVIPLFVPIKSVNGQMKSDENSINRKQGESNGVNNNAFESDSSERNTEGETPTPIKTVSEYVQNVTPVDADIITKKDLEIIPVEPSRLASNLDISRETKLVINNNTALSAKSPEVPQGTLQSLKTILSTRGFYIITLTNVSITMLASLYGLLIEDYAVDKKLERGNGVYMMTTNAVAELIGTLFLGWVSDHICISKVTFLTATQLVTASVVLVIPHVNEFYAQMVCAAVIGLGQGACFSISSVTYTRYISKINMYMAVSLTRSIVGLTFLPRAPLVGYFRDTLGSYDHLFHMLSGLLYLSGIAWTLELIFTKLKNNSADKDSKNETQTTVVEQK